ncbi:MAG: type IV pilus assembly protein PilM [bacterium]
MDFLNLKTEAFGLDISDFSLKIIKLKKKGSFFRLASFGEQKIKAGIIKEGEIKKKEALVEIVKEALSKIQGEKIKTKYAVVSLPEEKAFLQIIQMPLMAEEYLKSAVIFEAENYIPLPIEKVYLDYEIMPQSSDSKDHLDILLAALPRDIIDPYVFCLKEAGLKILALEIESLSIARALIKNGKNDQPVFLIDLGASRTSFIAFDGCVKFTSSIPVSGRHFTQLIARNLGVGEAQAENLKLKYGLGGKPFGQAQTGQKGKIFEALIPALVDLIQQVKKHLDFYQTHDLRKEQILKAGALTKVLICGGGANLKGLTDLLFSELKIPVEISNPWINILPENQKETPQMSREDSLRYATALGLALRGVFYSKKLNR